MGGGCELEKLKKGNHGGIARTGGEDNHGQDARATGGCLDGGEESGEGNHGGIARTGGKIITGKMPVPRGVARTGYA